MKHSKLDAFEKEILRDFEDGKMKPVENLSEAKTLCQEYVRAHLASLALKQPKA